MIIQVLLRWLLRGSIFLPRGRVVLPMIFKWLFVIEFWFIVFIVIFYCIFGYNMDDNIELYNEKILILEFINCKLNENVMRIGILKNHGMIETMVLLILLLVSYSLWIINKHIMCYYASKVSKFFYIAYTMFIVSIQNGDSNDLCSTRHHAQIKWDQLRQIYINSVYDL